MSAPKVKLNQKIAALENDLRNEGNTKWYEFKKKNIIKIKEKEIAILKKEVKLIEEEIEQKIALSPSALKKKRQETYDMLQTLILLEDETKTLERKLEFLINKPQKNKLNKEEKEHRDENKAKPRLGNSFQETLLDE